LDRAIDIKRRAQRCIQSGDLPGALAEYEKLVAADATDPYTYVLLADLLYKMGEHPKAGERYLTAAACYEQAGLYKNAIAVGKKMLRLALSPGRVLERLAALHALDGLPTEASLYYTQYAEHLVRESKVREAAEALRKAFDSSPENVRALERLAEVHSLDEDSDAAARVLAEAASHYRRAGQAADADRCRARAEKLKPGIIAAYDAETPPPYPGAEVEAPASKAGWSAHSFGLAPEPGEASSLETSAESGPPRLAENEISAGLETERAPRFVPPSADLPHGMEIERYAPTVGVGAAAGAQNGKTSPEAPLAPPALEDLAPDAAPTGIEGVERLLGLAQTEFRAGRHAEAAQILARAAAAYESFGHWEEAASIHRSLCKSPHATVEMLHQWLANCEQRGERAEAAQVACELGDRALQADERETAVAWFERATAFDPANAIAARRLERLGVRRPAPPAPAPAPSRAAAPPPPEPAVTSEGEGKVEVAVDRGQAVTFDFASMLAEFQRGVETQLSGDSQAHYDLAMAYREMGLAEQAIESFRLAAQDDVFRQRSLEMIGRCMLEEGRFEEAAGELTQALAFAALEPEVAIGVRFQLGIALEAAGRPQEALAEFEHVFEVQANYPDVAIKIRDLRKHLEAA
jgi:tetratricopeptide (TPR) repeat protein